jgi:hypothetical protein
MEPADSIRTRGFRRWYEQQLYESFAFMITGLVSLIMMAIALEATEFRKSAGGLVALACIAVAGGSLCVFAWRRFHRLLGRAEYLAERATCDRCKVYARFEVLRSREDSRSPAGCVLDVRCRNCGCEWSIG